MSARAPLPGPGRFQWNTGGWFGGQFGCTAWMLVGAAVAAPQAPWLAAWWAGCCACANAAGAWLWLRRGRVRPYPATQALLAACGLGGLLAVAGLHLFGPADVRLGVVWRAGRLAVEGPPGGTLRPAYAFLLLGVPVMMGWFALMERAAAKAGPRA